MKINPCTVNDIRQSKDDYDDNEKKPTNKIALHSIYAFDNIIQKKHTVFEIFDATTQQEVDNYLPK